VPAKVSAVSGVVLTVRSCSSGTPTGSPTPRTPSLFRRAGSPRHLAGGEGGRGAGMVTQLPPGVGNRRVGWTST
jgi:hypothetical protein